MSHTASFNNTLMPVSADFKCSEKKTKINRDNPRPDRNPPSIAPAMPPLSVSSSPSTAMVAVGLGVGGVVTGMKGAGVGGATGDGVGNAAARVGDGVEIGWDVAAATGGRVVGAMVLGAGVGEADGDGNRGTGRGA